MDWVEPSIFLFCFSFLFFFAYISRRSHRSVKSVDIFYGDGETFTAVSSIRYIDLEETRVRSGFSVGLSTPFVMRRISIEDRPYGYGGFLFDAILRITPDRDQQISHSTRTIEKGEGGGKKK